MQFKYASFFSIGLTYINIFCLLCDLQAPLADAALSVFMEWPSGNIQALLDAYQMSTDTCSIQQVQSQLQHLLCLFITNHSCENKLTYLLSSQISDEKCQEQNRPKKIISIHISYNFDLIYSWCLSERSFILLQKWRNDSDSFLPCPLCETFIGVRR